MSLIKDYKFQSFDSQLDERSGVNDFEFKEFCEKEVFDPKEKSKIIKAERTFSRENDFIMSPIVKEYRGHSEQERIEKERRIQDEVEKRVEKIKDEAFKKGYESGILKGKEEVFNQTRKETEEKLDSLVEMVNEVLAFKDKAFVQQRHDILKMVQTLTKWIILRELKGDDDYLNRLLEKLIMEMQTKSNLLVKVSKDSFEQMPDVLEHLERKIGELKNVRVEIDYEIKDGGIILESDNGIINGTLDQQLSGLDKLFVSVGVNE